MPDLDRLYAAPLDQFTAVRNEIADELRSAGDAEAAKEVRALKKPSVVVWTVNQLTRRHAADVERLLDVGDRLTKAHRKALSTAAGAGELREVAKEEKDVVAALLAKAQAIMKEAGISASANHLAQVEETLSAAAVDGEARDLLSEGRLQAPMQRVGFGEVTGLTVLPGGQGRSAGDEEDREARARAAELEREARAAERAAERLERAAETAESRAAVLREKLADVEAEAKKALDEARAAREAAVKAREVAGPAS